jgi:hypothetical protein
LGFGFGFWVLGKKPGIIGFKKPNTKSQKLNPKLYLNPINENT